MNLGAYYASGDYINYMNSGDYFYDKYTIRDIFKKNIFRCYLWKLSSLLQKL